MTTWRTQLRELREAEGLSRGRLAELSNVSAETVKAYELGLRGPSHSALTALLGVLKADRLVRNQILAGANFAPDGDQLGPSNADYMFTLEEAIASLNERHGQPTS